MDRYLLQLMLSKGIGDVAIKKLLNRLRMEDSLSSSDFCRDPLLLQQILYRNGSVDETFRSVVSNESAAEHLLEELKNNDVSIVTEIEDDYPQKLKVSLGKNCPPVLFLKGNKELLNSVSVGFCGSRKVSEKGIIITEQCSRQLVDRNITVISGYAGGTDLAAHKAALEACGNTVFVLAEGIGEYKDKGQIKPLLNDKNHLFVSQFLPHTKWMASNAMRRNSTIIGLSKAMILVESGKTGGTFAAGEEALKREVPLFVIDYAKPEVSAEANPYFIQNGGKPIRSRQGQPNLEPVFRLPDVISNQKQLSMF